MEILQLAEYSDAFRERVAASPINKLARRGCDYTAWPDQSESKAIQHTFSQSIPNTQIAILSPSAEAGMPHTRAPNVICLPAYYPQSKLQETLKHEMIHIDQRNRFEKWKGLVLEEGWSHLVDANEIPEEWRSRCRINPDTLLYPFFAWEGRHVPMPIFERADNPRLQDVEICWFDRRTGRVSKQVPISLTSKYGSLSKSEMEHPFELLAYRLSKF
jgi:hypothetical protein